MSLKRKADRHDGPIETHPEVGDGKAYKLVKSEMVLVEKNKRRFVTLTRMADNHPFTMLCFNFCAGKRPPDKFVYQLECIVSGEFTLVNEEDAQLGQGANKKIKLVRMRDNHPFTARCDSFCAGKRPLDKFVYQLECIASGEFKLVNEKDAQLGQGAKKKIKVVRTRDNHEFSMRCDAFCAGKRPPAKFVYQLECIVNGEFTVVNDEDAQLGQGSAKKITLVRTRDNHKFTMKCACFCIGKRPPAKFVYQLECIVNGEFTVVNEEDAQLGQGSGKKIELVRTHDQRHITERCDVFCSRICFHCLEMSHCTYAQNTCASCWCVQYPGAALAVTPVEGNKTEILVAAMLEAHLGRVRKEHPTRDQKREDVVLMSTMLAVAIDGVHHFFDTNYGSGLISCSEVQRVDTDKCRWWFADHPGASYVRMPQRPAWRGYPVNQLKPISFDFVNAIDYVNQNPDLYGGKVVFLEKTDRPTLYGEHRRLLDVETIEHMTLDPRTIDYGPNRITEDKRAILSQ
jgi:hypothetical protein